MSAAYINCNVLPGLFDNEYYVMVNGSSAYYIHKANVELTKQPAAGQAVIGRVKAYVVEQQEDKTLIQLPGEPVVGGVRTWVQSEAVTAA